MAGPGRQEEMIDHLRLPPKRSANRRSYEELLPPEGWAMDFVSDWVVGPNEQAVRIINIMDECSRTRSQGKCTSAT